MRDPLSKWGVFWVTVSVRSAINQFTSQIAPQTTTVARDPPSAATLFPSAPPSRKVSVGLTAEAATSSAVSAVTVR